MTSKNTFSRFFSFLIMATLLVACSQNDDNAMTTTKTATQANRLASGNIPHGKLIIRNHTQYTFIDYLGIVYLLTGTWVSQKIIINPYTNYELEKFSSTTAQDMDYDGNGTWLKSPLVGDQTIIDAGDADNGFRSEFTDPITSLTSKYVEWFSFVANSTDEAVKFGFKVSYQSGEILVPDPQGTFTTTAYVDDLGNIIIILEE